MSCTQKPTLANSSGIAFEAHFPIRPKYDQNFFRSISYLLHCKNMTLWFCLFKSHKTVLQIQNIQTHCALFLFTLNDAMRTITIT
uniref:Uncharacterized protein n=1 Tax=Pyxicephalus adspersus TaxID=30357 RepID=A0AAV2ZUL0_PYXAD|nr:TPA: hypothetical protein GDO54_016400 [Pyxicephalus adspersus]